MAHRRTLVGVITDIDDTLTTDGAITPDALAALRALKAAGLAVIAVTGRPMGWSREIAAHWPLDAVVAENGGGAWVRPDGSPWRDGAGPLSTAWYAQPHAERAANASRLQAAARQVLTLFAQATLARDSAGRETDIAIDQHLRGQGLTVTVSSIHVNAWIGAHDKLIGARWIVQRLLGRDLDSEAARWACVGDSANDERLFAHFTHSIGVANLAPVAHTLRTLPRYLTPSPRGAGVAEVAATILQAKRSHS